MGADHDHGDASTIRHERPLWWALGLTCLFLCVEVVAGFATNSLALLSDAAHMGTDVLALGIALTAVRLARRPPDAQRTYGYVRLEALSALVNGALLFALAAWVLWEAVVRMREPPRVASTAVIVVAALGLVANLISMKLLSAGRGESMSIEGAYLEVWADMLGSIGVLVGAVLIEFTGWQWIDPLVGAGLGLWVLPRAARLIREAAHVLLEGAPRGLDVGLVRAALRAHEHVLDVHDLHVWALASKTPALTAHVVLAPDGADSDHVRRRLAALLVERFAIHHATLQMETARCEHADVCESGDEAHEHVHEHHDHDHDAHDHDAHDHDAHPHDSHAHVSPPRDSHQRGPHQHDARHFHP